MLLEENEGDSKELDRSWKKLEYNAKTGGFREGIEAGKESRTQIFFDQGYIQGFKCGFEIGKYKAIITRSQNTDNEPSHASDLLVSPANGYCVICSHEEYLSTSIDNITEKQLDESNKNLNKLHTICASASQTFNLVKELKHN